MCVCHVCQKPEWGVGAPELGHKHCELHDMDVGNWTWDLWKQALLLLSHRSSPNSPLLRDIRNFCVDAEYGRVLGPLPLQGPGWPQHHWEGAPLTWCLDKRLSLSKPLLTLCHSPSSSRSAPPAAEWAVPQSSRLKYRQLFNSHDKTMSGHLTGIYRPALIVKCNHCFNMEVLSRCLLSFLSSRVSIVFVTLCFQLPITPSMLTLSSSASGLHPLAWW